MPLTRRHRFAAAATAFVAVAATASGITYAATTVPSSVKACENRSGTLRLLSSSGRCARGYTKISIGKVGPRGPQGVRGLRGLPGQKGDQGIQGIQGVQGIQGDQGIQGIQGDAGPQGPGATSLTVHSISGSAAMDHVVPGFGITVRAVCLPGSQSSIYLMDSGGSDFDVRGDASNAPNGAGNSVLFWDGVTTHSSTIGTGSSPLSYQQAASTNRSFEVIGSSGQMYANLLVTRAGKTFTVQMYAEQAADTCTVQAQVTPAS